MSDHILRAKRKEQEAAALLREAAYLRDLDRRLKALPLGSNDAGHGNEPAKSKLNGQDA
jgi:hypothetical protein